MSLKSVKEQVSALVDSQTDVQDTQAVLDKVKSDSSLADSFGRYHLIGDTMRNELPDSLNFDLASSIADAIDKEPVTFAPNVKLTAATEETPQTNDTTRKAKVIRWFKPAAQYGVAASFAAALVLGFQVNQVNQDVQVTQPVLQTFPIGGSLDPVSMQQSQAIPVTDNSYDVSLQRQRINAYIMDHAQQLKVRQPINPDTRVSQTATAGSDTLNEPTHP